MRREHRALLLGSLTSTLLLSGCNFDLNGGTSSNFAGSVATSPPTTTPLASGGGGPPMPSGLTNGAPAIGPNDRPVATPSISGPVSVIVGSSQTLSITFTSSDGRTLGGLALEQTALPAGWAGPANFACASVSTGSGCVLNLTYTPTMAGSGTFTLKYIYLNGSGAPQTTPGSIQLSYVATTNDNVVAMAAPSGQIDAVVGSGSQSVGINFTTDDGNPATALTLTTSLTTLPPGWSSTATSFSCASVSTGNGCQLSLTYAPSAAATGTLTLNYSYVNNAGLARTGALNIPYAGTTRDNVVGTVAPTGQINAVVGAGNQPVTITFATDDGNAASSLALTSDLTALPAGWSSTASTFSCTAVSTGSGCQLALSYAPGAAASGTLTLNYTYDDNSGTAKTGMLNIPYAATTDDNVAGTPSVSPISVASGSSAGVLVSFATDDGNPATALSISTDLTALPAGWSSSSGSFGCASVSAGPVCQLSLTYAPVAPAAGTLTLAFSYTNDAGNTKNGTVSIVYTATP
jgi:hypothetical protein